MKKSGENTNPLLGSWWCTITKHTNYQKKPCWSFSQKTTWSFFKFGVVSSSKETERWALGCHDVRLGGRRGLGQQASGDVVGQRGIERALWQSTAPASYHNNLKYVQLPPGKFSTENFGTKGPLVTSHSPWLSSGGWDDFPSVGGGRYVRTITVLKHSFTLFFPFWFQTMARFALTPDISPTQSISRDSTKYKQS